MIDLQDKGFGLSVIVLAIIGFILNKVRVKRIETLEAQVETAEAKKQDAVLANEQAHVEAKIAEAVSEGEEARKQTLSPEELAKELDKV